MWRRVWHLPNAKKLFERVSQHAATGDQMNGAPQSYFHQVLSTSQLNTGVQQGRPSPGGIVQLGADPNYGIMGPSVSAPMVTVHELWVQDDEDYTTILMVEPDVIIAPLHRKMNLLIQGSQMQPYRLIQPNEVTNWFWGRSELVDLIEPQGLLATWLDDLSRLTGLQVDKLLMFVGENGLTDEKYGEFRAAGYGNLPPGSDVKDVTPKIPPELLTNIKFLLDTINNLSGFPPIMSGQGEPGVRAGVHANTLLKTASPTLRDRSLIVEQQCAATADLTATLREAKDPEFYWTKGDTAGAAEETKFLISQLPEDWRITVDSHSSSPIFSDENTQLVTYAQKAGIVDGEYFIDNTMLPNKAAAKTSFKEREARKAAQQKEMMQQFPELGEKLALKMMTGGKK